MSESGKRIALVIGYACHNTTIPPEDGRYCGDWAGFAKEHIEQSFPGATAVFIPGAGADQDPEPTGSIELSRQHGRELANAVELTLGEPGIEIIGPIHTEWTDVLLPLQPVTPESIAAMLASNDPPQQVKARFLQEALRRGETLITSYSAPLQVVRFGDECLLVALSGEPVVDWSHKFKRRAGSTKHGAGTLESESSPPTRDLRHSLPLVWVAGYCNDMFGYLPTRRVQAEGGYEGGRANLWSWMPAPFTGDVEDRIIDAVRKLVDCVSQEPG